jgi:ubiquitin C-terminal hydrolase
MANEGNEQISSFIPLSDGINIDECIKSYFSDHVRTEEGITSFCSQCLENNQFNDKFEVTSFPKILLIMIRFALKCENIQSVINFQEKMYKIKSVILFHSTSSNVLTNIEVKCGHYTSLICEGDKWFYCNDEIVEEVEGGMQEIHRRFSSKEITPYLLFFEKL